MDVDRIKLAIQLLEVHLAMIKDFADPEKIQSEIAQTQEALQRIINDYDGKLEILIDYSDNESRINVDISLNAKVYMDEPLPDYLPIDIFLQLKDKSISEMMHLLKNYGMPEHEIKLFLRRIFPADDAL